MLTQYIQHAMENAHYELIEDEEPYYGEIPGLDGVWATGKTLEACRRHLGEAVEDWVLFSIANGYAVPPLQGITIRMPDKVMT